MRRIVFEIATKKAFEKVFIGILVKGCLFHFGQSLFRKFVSLGLKTYYIEKKDVQDWFKSIFCLALLPINSVEQEFELLSIKMTQNDVEPPQTEPIEPPQTEPHEPPQTEAIEPPQIIRTTTPPDEQSRTVDSCLINLRNAACCVQPRDYGCPPNDIDEDFLNEIEDRGQTFINLQPRRGLVTQQTQIQFTQIQSQEESETTHLISQLNNSSLLENTDFEDERAEIPPETIIPPKANTAKCIHCGKS